MLYFAKCEILNETPVFVTFHFQYRVKLFFTEILMRYDFFGEIKHHAIRVECQFRGSPHIHFFLWILNPLKLSKKTIKKHFAFLDQTIHSFLPDQTIDKDLYHLVNLCQTHQHSKSCKKYKSEPTLYKFGCFFIDRTLVAVLPDQFVDILKKS